MATAKKSAPTLSAKPRSSGRRAIPAWVPRVACELPRYTSSVNADMLDAITKPGPKKTRNRRH
jgi:hypothetical protein